MAAINPCLIRSTNACGELLVRLDVPVLDDYLRFVAARARPNTVLATAYDLVVLFRVVCAPPSEVTSADVLRFITAFKCTPARTTDSNPEPSIAALRYREVS